jgi:outer membrane immunogenic protein
MAKLFRGAIFLGLAAAFMAVGGSESEAQNVARMEIGGEYNYVHANAPPSGCGCFSMNGGAGWFAYNFSHNWSAVGEIGGEHAGNINGSKGDLTVSSYLGGPRYAWRGFHRWVPFGQYLIGGAHGTGALTPALDGLPGGANAFATSAGAGVDVEVSHDWAVRLGEVDYYLTRFDNGVNHHQNNLRVGVGIAYRFGRGK